MHPHNSNTTSKKTCAIIVALITWFAIVLQLYLTTGSVANFFSYFTILCNLLVAVSLTWSLLLPNTTAGKYFSRFSVQTAIALYIFIVALVYNTVLRGLLQLSDWPLVADTLLHVIVPLLYIFYWVIFVPGENLKWRDGIYWLVFPLLYLIYSLIRGAVVHWYPYPFLNAEALGYPKVSVNILIMLTVFLASGFLLIISSRSAKRKGNL